MSRSHRSKYPVDALLWVFPVVTLGIGAVIHGMVGESLTPGFILAAPAIGVLLSLFCVLWGRLKRRQIVKQLAAQQEELEESRLFLENVVDSSPDPIFISDLRGEITFASRSAARLTDRPSETLVGQSVEKFLQDGQEEARRIRAILDDSRRVSGYRTTVVTPKGTSIPVGISASYLRRPDGSRHGILVALQDLTERVSEEQRAMEAERLRLLGESVAGIAHELNNPLTGVIGYLQLAAAGADEERREILAKAGREADRMAQTLRMLLDFARKRGPERAASDIAEVIGQVCEFHGYHLKVSGIELVVEVDDLPPVLIDRHQIRQVFLNLIRNAEDAILEGGTGGRIEVRAEQAGNSIRITVDDDGPGVPEEIGERVFEHFYTTKPSGKGTGLGLSICRQIAESHGGSISLAEKEGRGARFLVVLPLVKAKPAEPAAEQDPVATDPLDILVVDDETGVRDYVATVLREAGHQVHEADGAIAAMARIRIRQVDLAFVDMRMPGMDGPQCVRLLLAERPSLEGRVIYMSGDGVPDPDGLFLSKPMTPNEILEAVKLCACGA